MANLEEAKQGGILPRTRDVWHVTQQLHKQIAVNIHNFLFKLKVGQLKRPSDQSTGRMIVRQQQQQQLESIG